MKKILVVYGSREGHTQRIAQFFQNQVAINNLKLLGQELQTISPNYNVQEELGVEVETIDLNTAYNDYQLDFSQYDAVVIGASIHYGLFPVELLALVERHYTTLNNMPSYFFAINLTARKENKNTPETNVYVRKFLAKSPWQPTSTAVFAGALNYSQLGKWDARIITFIMWLTKGDTDPTTQKVYTNWDSVALFTSMVCKKVTGQALIDYPLSSLEELSNDQQEIDKATNLDQPVDNQQDNQQDNVKQELATDQQTSQEQTSSKQTSSQEVKQDTSTKSSQDDAEFVSHLNVQPRNITTNPSEPPKL